MIYSIDVNDKKITLKEECEEKCFKDWGLKEDNIEEFICSHPEVIFDDDENCILVGRQVVDKARKKNDLMAIDSDGNLILIELKRDKADMEDRQEPLEFQAIRYCASLAKIKTPEDLVSTSYAKYIEKYETCYSGELTPFERARQKLNSFLARTDSLKDFNEKQKIILVASDYDETTLSACAWMISNGINMKLIKIVPVVISGKKALEVSTVMPTKKPEDYYVDLIKHDESSPSNNKTSITRTNKPRMPKLIEWGIVRKGMKLFIKGYNPDEYPDEIAEVVDYKYVMYKGDKVTFNEWGCSVTGWSALCIYEWAIEVGKVETLDELRNKKISEIEIQNPDE